MVLAADADDEFDHDPTLAACVQRSLAGPHLAPAAEPAAPPPLLPSARTTTPATCGRGAGSGWTGARMLLLCEARSHLRRSLDRPARNGLLEWNAGHAPIHDAECPAARGRSPRSSPAAHLRPAMRRARLGPRWPRWPSRKPRGWSWTPLPAPAERRMRGREIPCPWTDLGLILD